MASACPPDPLLTAQQCWGGAPTVNGEGLGLRVSQAVGPDRVTGNQTPGVCSRGLPPGAERGEGSLGGVGGGPQAPAAGHGLH